MGLDPEYSMHFGSPPLTPSQKPATEQTEDQLEAQNQVLVHVLFSTPMLETILSIAGGSKQGCFSYLVQLANLVTSVAGSNELVNEFLDEDQLWK